jgi:hypothetical protein
MGPAAKDLVIVSRALADLAQFLQDRQQSAGRGRVILDRRVGERRRAVSRTDEDRREADRRQPPREATEALMRVLGFTVIQGDGASAGSASGRDAKHPDPARRALGRRRRVAGGHRVRRRRS